jgi:hypothetical protein
MKSFKEFLTEKQIQYSNNANYGQIVFFAGGAGSGKGFSISHFIDHTKFKIRDVDSIKLSALKMPQLLKKYPEIHDFDLKNPEDVSRLHAIVNKEKLPEKQMDLLLAHGMHNRNTLPNILFDCTLKDVGDLDKYVPALVNAGYDPKNIHITWVLANYEIAIKNNAKRDRVVSPNILNITHNGAALTMSSLLNGKLPHLVNGSVTIVLNNPENVVWYDYSNKPIERKNWVVSDFTYLKVKKEGQKMPTFVEMDQKIRETLTNWVLNNAPQNPEIHNAWIK